MDNNHSQLIKLLGQLYGSYTEQNGRINFNKQHSKIAKDLGYDETAFSRILNPPIDKNPSAKNYQRLFIRIETKLENKQLKEQIELLKEEKTEQVKALQKENIDQRKKHTGIWMLLAFLSMIAVAFGSHQMGKKQVTDDIKILPQEYRLTKNQRHALNKLYAENLQYKMALEAAIFHSSMKDGIYGNEVKHHLQESAKKLPVIITDTRNLIQDMNLKAENNTPIFDFYKEYSVNNNVQENFSAMIPFLINPELPTSELVDLIMKKIGSVQMHTFNKIDSVVTSSSLLHKG